MDCTRRYDCGTALKPLSGCSSPPATSATERIHATPGPGVALDGSRTWCLLVRSYLSTQVSGRGGSGALCPTCKLFRLPAILSLVSHIALMRCPHWGDCFPPFSSRPFISYPTSSIKEWAPLSDENRTNPLIAKLPFFNAIHSVSASIRPVSIQALSTSHASA